MKIKINKNRKGSILAYILIMVSISSIILSAITYFVVMNIRFVNTRDDREQSLQIAEAGIYYYRWYLAHKSAENPTKKQLRQFWESGSAQGVGVPYEADYEGIGKYSITVIPPESNSTIAIVESTGWTYKHPNYTRTIRVRFRQPSWSEFAVLANDKHSHIRFGAGTEVFGPIHSNGGIRFDGLIHNVISSSYTNAGGLPQYNDPDHGGGDEFAVHTHIAPIDPLPPAAMPNRPDVFEVGRRVNVPEKDFNAALGDLADMKDEAGCLVDGAACGSDSIVGSNGVYFNDSGEGRHIILKTNGTFDVSRVTNYNTTSNGIISETGFSNFNIPDDGIIFVEDNVWVEGQINDKMFTIAAANLATGGSYKNIFIENDIKYTNYDGTDIIGLVSQNDIEIIRSSENDLRVDAALLAQNGRVGRKHYGWYCVQYNWWGGCIDWDFDQKDVILVHGSIATAKRYGFAWTDGSGYQDRILEYDNNLLYYPPPYFPTGTEYAIDLWEEL